MPSKNLNVSHDIVDKLDELRKEHDWSYSQAIAHLLKEHEAGGSHPPNGIPIISIGKRTDEELRAMSLGENDAGRLFINTTKAQWEGWTGSEWKVFAFETPVQEALTNGKPPIAQVKRAEFVRRMPGYVLEAAGRGSEGGYEYDAIYNYIRSKYGHMVTKTMVADTISSLLKDKKMVEVGHKYGNRIHVKAVKE